MKGPKNGYCEIVIRYTRNLSNHTLAIMQRELEAYGSKFTPSLPVVREYISPIMMLDSENTTKEDT